MSYIPAYDPETWKIEDAFAEPLEVKVSGLNRNICEDEYFEDKVILEAVYEA